jgi:hypothetical protein
VLSSPGSTVNTGPSQGGAAAPAAPGGAQKTRGSGWTNLKTYVDANQGADEDMAVKTEAKFDETAAAGDQARGSYRTAATTAVAAGSNADPNVAKALAKPGQANQVKAEDFTRALQGYTGPTDRTQVTGYEDAGKASEAAAKKGAAAGGFESRRELLTDAFGRPTYSAGEQRLDSFIFGAGDRGKKAVESIQGKGAAQTKGWEELTGRVDHDIGIGKQVGDSVKRQVEEAYGGAKARTAGQIETAKTIAKGRSESNASTFARLEAGLLSEDPAMRASAARELGVSPAEVEALRKYPGGVQQIIQRATDQSFADVLDPSVEADYAALNALASGAGIEGLGPETFTKTGAKGSAYNVANKDKLTAAGKAAEIEARLQKALAQRTSQRDTQYRDVERMLASGDPDIVQMGVNLLGLDPQQALQLGLAPSNKIDLRQFLKKGKALNAGDVANDADRSGWGELMALLGGDAGVYADTQDEGRDVGFDYDAYMAAIAAANVNNVGVPLPGRGAAAPATTAAPSPSPSNEPKSQLPRLPLPPIPNIPIPKPSMSNPVPGLVGGKKKRPW